MNLENVARPRYIGQGHLKVLQCWDSNIGRMRMCVLLLQIKVPEMKIAEFANSRDPDEVAHNEPPHLELRCLPSSL